MSFKITGTVKFNQFSHEYALDLNVTEVQPELVLPWYSTVYVDNPYTDFEVPSTFIVELGTRGEWSQSGNHGLCGVNFATRGLAEEAKERFGNYGLDYRVTEVPATVDAVPEVEPSTFVVDAFINAEWIRSGNTGLSGIRFATRAKALEAIIEYGNIDSVKYRVTEVTEVTQ